MPNYIGTGLPEIPAAQYIDWVPIQSQTASGVASLAFTGMNSDFDEYKFEFVNMHPATDNVTFGFQVNAPGAGAAADFNETITSSYFRAKHNEDDSAVSLDYVADFDQPQGTAYQVLPNEVGNDSDQSTSGVLTIYAPSSTTYVKHFQARFNDAHPSDIHMDCFIAGYVNTTTAIDEINFKFSSGNIDAGTITMYGLSK